MRKNNTYEFACPQCLKRASCANPMFIRYSFRRLELRIFLCSDCSKVYLDEPTIRRLIKEWRQDDKYLHRIPLETLVREFMTEMEESIKDDWTGRLGYKRAKFIKRKVKKIPGK